MIYHNFSFLTSLFAFSVREFETTVNINSLGQGLKQIHTYNHLQCLPRPGALKWSSSDVLWDMNILEFWLLFHVREFMWLNFGVQPFLPISKTFTHTEKPSITKPQDIKTHNNYPLRMHEDIMILISVCHYLLYFFLFPRKHITLLFRSCSLFQYLFSNFLDFKTVPHLNNKSTYPYNRSQESHPLQFSVRRSLNDHTHQLAHIMRIMHANVKIRCLYDLMLLALWLQEAFTIQKVWLRIFKYCNNDLSFCHCSFFWPSAF